MAIFSEVLPEEMVFEVLQRLPVKSRLSIISDPEFVKTHSKNMALKKVSLLLFMYNQQPDLLVPFSEFDFYLLLLRDFIVIGSCNGIICLKHDNDDVHLWNPSIKQWKTLPKFLEIERTTDPIIRLAFGFDNISNDYKVVRFVCPPPDANIVPVVQLYSANADSWKEIRVDHPLISSFLCNEKLNTNFCPVINGVLYMSFRGCLVSFNLHDEVFIVDSFPRYMVRYSGIIDFEGSVAVISKSVDEGSEISLYTQDKYPGGVSWSKKFVTCNDICWVYSFLGDGLLYARNLVTKFKHSVSFQLPPRVQVFKYTETLVSIKGFVPLTSESLLLTEEFGDNKFGEGCWNCGGD